MAGVTWEAVIPKKVGERLLIGLRWKSPDLISGETITNVVCTTTLSKEGSPSIDGWTVRQMVYGGVVNTDYEVEFTITTSTGQIYINSLLINVI